MMPYAYWDEEGNYHHHDNNSHTDSYSCSEGHSVVIRRANKCSSCDFGDTEDRVTVTDSKPQHIILDGSGLVKFE